MMVQLAVVFAAGCVGGLANSLAVWGFGKLGATQALGVKIVPEWTPAWLYPRIVWGGLWGFLFLLPWFENDPFTRGAFFSLAPTAVVLFVVFPYQAKKGMMGLELGKLTPLYAFAVNAIWGIAASYWVFLT